jgi:hypothetical protein
MVVVATVTATPQVEENRRGTSLSGAKPRASGLDCHSPLHMLGFCYDNGRIENFLRARGQLAGGYFLSVD